jgi:hypothetical protein
MPTNIPVHALKPCDRQSATLAISAIAGFKGVGAIAEHWEIRKRQTTAWDRLLFATFEIGSVW